MICCRQIQDCIVDMFEEGHYLSNKVCACVANGDKDDNVWNMKDLYFLLQLPQPSVLKSIITLHQVFIC